MNTTSERLSVAFVAAIAGVVCHGWEFKSLHTPVAEVVVSVSDNSGCMVSNADVSVWFEDFKTPEGIEVKGKSDADGVFTAVHRTPSSGVFISAKKDGCYSSSMSVSIRDFPDKKEEFEKAFKRDRWSERPASLGITLKRIIEPKRLSFHSCHGRAFPCENGIFALDLETLEWCPPYGNGKHGDAILSLESKGDPHGVTYLSKLALAMPNAADGFYVGKLDSTSGFPYAYRADTNAAYRKEGVLLLDRREGHIVERQFPADDEYLVFRIRTVTNAEGRVTSAHYGRIGEMPSHLFGLKAAVWFNPDENDTNLEDGWH